MDMGTERKIGALKKLKEQNPPYEKLLDSLIDMYEKGVIKRY